MDMDLDINNYELTDILNLFKIPVLFNDKHLREAKVIVLQMPHCVVITVITITILFLFLMIYSPRGLIHYAKRVTGGCP